MKKPFSEKIQISFSDLAAEYQNHFYKHYALTAGALILAVIFSIMIRRYMYILWSILIALGYAAYLSYQIYRSLIGKVLVYDLECTDIERKERTLLGSKSMGAKTCNMTLRSSNDLNFVQAVGFSTPYKIGDTVRIYAEESSVTQMNSNTFTIINPIFMHVLATSTRKV